MARPDGTPPLPEEYRGRSQSYVKHLVLSAYLERAAMVILSAWPDFVFVDGFSGPWRNSRPDLSDTSFGIAVRELRAARANWAVQNRQRQVRCVFVERRAEAYARLRQASNTIKDMEVTPLRGQFEDHIDEIKRIAGRSFTLTFVDPTGWSFDLQKLAPLLRRKPGEVLVNFMYEHFRRFIEDKRSEIRSSQDRAFGGAAWRNRYASLLAQGLNKEEAALEVFKFQLRKVCDFDFVGSARIRHPTARRTHFYLVYGTRSLKGLVEFRRAEKEALRGEEALRVQAQDHAQVDRTGQTSMFSALEATGAPDLPDPRREEQPRLEAWLKRALDKKSFPFIPFTHA
jgi:three-Cys-motif partner protein